MLQVPDRYVKALEKPRQLPDTSFDELLAGLSRVTLSSSRDQLTDEARNFTPSIKPKDLEDLLSLLVSLKGAQEQAEESTDFADDVLSAISRTDEPKLERASAINLPRHKCLLSVLVRNNYEFPGRGSDPSRGLSRR